MRGVRRVKVKG